MSFLWQRRKVPPRPTTTTTKKRWGNYKEQKAHDRHWSQQDTVTVAEQKMIYDSLA
jgi:hypothetical protein